MIASGFKYLCLVVLFADLVAAVAKHADATKKFKSNLRSVVKDSINNDEVL
jgi:hypothetical protein